MTKETIAQAYATGEKLQARIDIYRYQRPRVDFHTFVLDNLALGGGERVLDVGCGTGAALERLSARRLSLALIGIDRSLGMLAESRSRVAGVLWVAGDVERLPLADGAFDAVLAMHMLYHAPNIEQAVGELRRVLRARGTLLASTLGRRHMGELHDLAAEVLDGAELDRPSHRFSLDDAALLRRHFADVRLDRLEGELVLHEPGPLVRYLDSARDLFEPTLPPGVAWAAVLGHVEHRLTDEIAATGAFRITTDGGVFVCR